MGERGQGRPKASPIDKATPYPLKLPAWLVSKLKESKGKEGAKYIKNLILRDSGWTSPGAFNHYAEDWEEDDEDGEEDEDE